MGDDALTRQDWLYWAAGYIDGEGAVLVRNTSGVEISVHSTVPATVERLALLFGGKLSYEEPRSGTHKGLHRWRVYGDLARSIAGELLETQMLLAKFTQALAVRDSKKYSKNTAFGQRLREDALEERRRDYGADGTPRR